MMTTRFTITAPDRDNDGRRRPKWRALSYSEFAAARVLEMFSGATAAPGRGYWRDPVTGARYVDRVTVWTVDAPDTRAGDVALVAAAIADYARQEAVYASATDGAGHRTALVTADGAARASAELTPTGRAPLTLAESRLARIANH